MQEFLESQLTDSQDRPALTKPACQGTEVFVWGSDRRGQLGIESQSINKIQTLPRSCSFNVTIQTVAIGERHSALITNQGKLYMMGANHKGQLGFAGSKIVSSPTLVESLKHVRVTQISCGFDFNSCLVQEGPQTSVWVWGANKYGQLGLPRTRKVVAPARLKVFDNLESQIVMVSCGDQHTLFLTSSGEAIATGQNKQGQCGFNPKECEQTDQPFKLLCLQEVRKIAAGQQHSLFLTATGQVYKTQDDLPFQVQIQNIADIAAGSTDALISEKGQLFLLNDYELVKVETMLAKAVQISVGQSGVALDEEGLVWVWGSNQKGQLGLGDQQHRDLPSPVLSLKATKISSVAAGGSSIICLGQPIRSAPRIQSQARPKSIQSIVSPRSSSRSQYKHFFKHQQPVPQQQQEEDKSVFFKSQIKTLQFESELTKDQLRQALEELNQIKQELNKSQQLIDAKKRQNDDLSVLLLKQKSEFSSQVEDLTKSLQLLQLSRPVPKAPSQITELQQQLDQYKQQQGQNSELINDLKKKLEQLQTEARKGQSAKDRSGYEQFVQTVVVNKENVHSPKQASYNDRLISQLQRKLSRK